MDEQEVLRVLGKVGAFIADSHIVYTSGKHGTTYVNKDAVYPHTAEISRLCHAIAERFADDNVEAVIAPAIGGVILSQRGASFLSAAAKVLASRLATRHEIATFPGVRHCKMANLFLRGGII